MNEWRVGGLFLKCVCVCVCVWEREWVRERESERESEWVREREWEREREREWEQVSDTIPWYNQTSPWYVQRRLNLGKKWPVTVYDPRNTAWQAIRKQQMENPNKTLLKVDQRCRNPAHRTYSPEFTYALLHGMRARLANSHFSYIYPVSSTGAKLSPELY
jgi:hypothetical protein